MIYNSYSAGAEKYERDIFGINQKIGADKNLAGILFLFYHTIWGGVIDDGFCDVRR